MRVHSPDPEDDTGQAIGTPLGGPSETFDYGIADIAFPADRTKHRMKAGVSFDALGSFGEGPEGLRARSTVVGQEVYPGMPQYREQFRFHAQHAGIGIAAWPDSRLHLTSIPGPPHGKPTM